MAPPRYPANPNTIKLTFDFDTLDRLKAEAKRRNVDATRCAYELVQEGLGARLQSAFSAATAAPDPHDEVHASVMRGLDAARNFKPTGRA